MTQTIPVSCPMDCFDLCRFSVSLTGNRITGMKGDPDHPLTRGIICAKGRDLPARFRHPDRLRRPLVRKNGRFVPTDYPEILDRVAGELTSVRSKWGPTAVLNYTSDGYGGMKGRIQSIFFNRFGGDTRFSGSLCWGAGIAAQGYDFGAVRGHLPSDVLNAGLVIVWGRNPRVTNLHFYTLLKQARKNGCRVIVVDPVETETAKAFDDFIQVRPGTDAALALGMAHIMVREDLADQTFIRDHVKGFQRFSAYLSGFPPEKAAGITGVDATVIERLARDYAAADPASIWIGYGLQRYTNGGNTVRCIDALAAVSGHIGRSGGGVNYAARSLAPFLNRPEKNCRTSETQTRTFPVPRLGAFLETADNPPVRAAFVAAGNPLNQSPDLNRTMAAFTRIPFKVVFDHFMTDTARQADIVLPAASVFEQDDLFATSMYSHVLNYSQQTLDPPDTLIPEFDFYLALAGKMGIDLGFSSSAEYLRGCAAPLLKRLDMDPETELTSLADAYIRIPDHDIAWADKCFATPSGRIEIFSETAAKNGLDPLPTFLPPRSGSQTFPLRLLTCKSRRSMHSQAFAFEDGPAICRVNRKTAQHMGVDEGDTVTVSSERGKIKAVLKLDKAVNNDTAFMHEGWWHKSGAVNFLTRDRISDMGNQAAYYDSFCRLDPGE